MERRTLVNKWQDCQWEAIGVVPAHTAETAPQRLFHDGATERWLFPGHTLALFSDEADNYLLNVTAPEPRVFVMWRVSEATGTPEPCVVTASYGEAARMMDSGEQVDGVPMSPDLRAWVEAFARVHYEPPEKKPKRFASSRKEAVR